MVKTRYLLLLLITLLSGFSLLAPSFSLAKRPDVSIDLPKDYVHITSAFSGEHLVLFGVQNKPGELVITVEGPKKKMVVRKKEKVFGMIWMNTQSQEMDEIPSYFTVASNVEALNLNNVFHNGFDVFAFGEDGYKTDKSKSVYFKNGLIRNKITQDLFGGTLEPISYIDEGFFRTQFYIPSNVSMGDFAINMYLLNGQRLRHIGAKTISVKQTGSAEAVLSFSRGHALLYGLLCMLFAMSIGWLSNYIRGRLR